MSPFLENLWRFLQRPDTHATLLVFAAAISVFGLLAIWAATSRAHWFLRSLALWAAVTSLLFIRAYEPVLLTALAGPLTVLLLVAFQSSARKGGPSVPAAANITERLAWRFTLRDLMFLVAALGMWLVTILRAARSIQTVHWLVIVTAAVSIAVLVALAHVVASGPRRRLAAALLVAAIPTATLAIRFVGDGGLWMHASWTCLHAIVLLYLVSLVLAGSLLARWANSRRHAAAGLVCYLLALCAPLGVLYWHMFWLTPLPPKLVSSPNHYDRILERGERVREVNSNALAIAHRRLLSPGDPINDELDALYTETLPLLAVDSHIDLDPAVDCTRTRLDRFLEDRRRVAALAACFSAESKAATDAGDLDRSVDFGVANLRLGSIWVRGNIAPHDSLGSYFERQGYDALARVRGQLSPAQAREVIAEIDRLITSRESLDDFLNRSYAIWERAGGWQASLEQALDEVRLASLSIREQAQLVRDRSETSGRLLQADLAVRMFQRDRGQLPHSLSDLVPDYLPAVPLDPFSGLPFCYRIEGPTFVLYGVGEDGVDNDGRFGNLNQAWSDNGYDYDLDTSMRP